MTSSPVSCTLRNAARRVLNPLVEIMHVSTVYLGIAVLVAAMVTLVLPSLRFQVQQAYVVFIAALKPDTFSVPFHYAQSGADDPDQDLQSALSPVLSAEELTPAQPAEQDTGTPEDETIVPAPHLNFTRALAHSEEHSSIPGVTTAQAQALRSYIARKYRIATNVAGALISTVFTVGRDMDLDPQLLLAVIAIESRYNPYAESHMGAQGLMQVMTRVHKDKFAAFGEGPLAAVHPLANIQVGAQILSDCINRRGSLDGGLACYVGATGPSDGGYGAKVKAEWRRIALASGIPINR